MVSVNKITANFIKKVALICEEKHNWGRWSKLANFSSMCRAVELCCGPWEWNHQKVVGRGGAFLLQLYRLLPQEGPADLYESIRAAVIGRSKPFRTVIGLSPRFHGPLSLLRPWLLRSPNNPHPLQRP